MAKRMTVQMKPHTFNPADPISIFENLKYLKLVWDKNGVQEGAAMRLFHFFMYKTESVMLIARLSGEGTDTKHHLSASSETRYLQPTYR